jgi:hypothetical protein
MDTKCHEEIIPHSTTSAKVLVNNIAEKEKLAQSQHRNMDR